MLYLALTELLQGASVYVNGDVALYMQTYFPNVPIPSYLYPVALPATVVTLVAVVCWLLRTLGAPTEWLIYPEFEEQNARLHEISHLAATFSDEQQEFLLGMMRLMRKQKYEG